MFGELPENVYFCRQLKFIQNHRMYIRHLWMYILNQ